MSLNCQCGQAIPDQFTMFAPHSFAEPWESSYPAPHFESELDCYQVEHITAQTISDAALALKKLSDRVTVVRQWIGKHHEYMKRTADLNKFSTYAVLEIDDARHVIRDFQSSDTPDLQHFIPERRKLAELIYLFDKFVAETNLPII